MKKKIFIFAIFLNSILTINAQTPEWEWAKSFKGSSYKTATDNEGNCYLTGGFNGTTIYFDSYMLNSFGASDVFVVKYNSSGNVEWAYNYGSSFIESGQSIAVDDDGNCYITGSFSGPTITLGTTTFTNHGDVDFFTIKINQSGEILWANSFGGSGNDMSTDISIDGIGNVFITGRYDSPEINIGADTLVSIEEWDIFVMKFDPEGNVAWGSSSGGEGVEYTSSICTDINGDGFIPGKFASPMYFIGNDTLFNPFGNEIFILKYDTEGNAVWYTNIASTSSSYGSGIDTDNSGNFYVTGYYNGDSISFDDVTLINTVDYTFDIYIVKFDSLYNVVWAKNAGGTSIDGAYDISTDSYGNSYITGEFSSNEIAFGPFTLIKDGELDIFVAKYDSNGNELWAISAGGDNYDEGLSVSSIESDNCYVTGHYMSNYIAFGDDTLINPTTTTYYQFVSKIGIKTGEEINTVNDGIQIYPNPTNGMIVINTEDVRKIQIMTLYGKEIYNGKENSIDLSSQPNGVYIIKVVSDDKTITEKLIKQ